MRGRRDLPGYSASQTTERLGVLAVQRRLELEAFKTTEVNGRFDDGLDLLVAPHDEHNVLPAIAGVQVRSGPSHRGIQVERPGRYWRDLNLPVLGVVISDPYGETPTGWWCNAQDHLRA